MFRFVERIRVINHLDLPRLLPDFGDGFFDRHLRRDSDVTGVHQCAGFILRIRRRGQTLAASFSNHCNFHLAGLLQDLVSEVQAGKPASLELLCCDSGKSG